MARRKRASFLSKQAPPSIRQRVRRVLIWVGALLGASVLCCIAAVFYLMSWVQGEGFRRYMTDKIRGVSHAQKVDIPENLQIKGAHLTLPLCTLQQAGFIRELSIGKLHMEVDRPALLSRVLRLRQFSAETMQMTLAAPRRGKAPKKATPAATGAVPAPTAAKAAPKPATAQHTATQPHTPPLALNIDTLPKGFFREIIARSFECHYTDTILQLDDRQFSLEGYHFIAAPRPDLGKGAWIISIENGRIGTPFSRLRECGVKSATLFFRDDSLQLSDARVLLTPGYLQAKGDYRLSTGLWQARLDIHRANVARILSRDWIQRLTGSLSGHLDLGGSAATGEWKARGDLHMENGRLEGLPILSDIKLHGTYPYRHIELEKAACRITFPYADPELGIRDAWLWDNIDIRTKDSTLLVRGRVITGQDGSLSGSLSIGFPAKTLADLGLSQTPLMQQLFNAPVQVPGYVWMQVNLSGTLAAPQEDLSVRLATILPELIPLLTGQAMNSLNSLLHSFIPQSAQPTEQQDTPGDPAPDSPQSPATTLPGESEVKGIIKSGLNLLF